MFGSLKKKISKTLFRRKKKSNKNQNALAAVGFCPAMGWCVHIGRARCHLTLTARTTLSFFSSLANRRKCEKKHISMASWRNLYMKSAERNSTMKDVCMLAQGTSRTTHIANIKRKGVSKEQRKKMENGGRKEKRSRDTSTGRRENTQLMDLFGMYQKGKKKKGSARGREM